MTAPSSPDRIRAVVVALEGGIPWASMWQQASAAVDALDAYDREHDPLHLAGMATIERDLRERIAADIEAMTLGQIGMHVSLFDAARDRAARIARGGQS